VPVHTVVVNRNARNWRMASNYNVVSVYGTGETIFKFGFKDRAVAESVAEKLNAAHRQGYERGLVDGRKQPDIANMTLGQIIKLLKK